MTVIWKYILDVANPVVAMPAGAEILHFGRNDDTAANTVLIWARVDPDQPREPHSFVVIGTGHPIPADAGPHRATVPSWPFVWHVFDRVRP